MYEKLKRDEEKAGKKNDADLWEKASNLQNFLMQYENIFDLLFMRDLSHILKYSSKEFQWFDVLLFYPMNVGEHCCLH